MDKDQLVKRLMTTFLEELEEHVQAFNRDLLALKKDPSEAERAERLKTLFRSAHSLKGASRSVNVTLLEKACHGLEEILAAVQEGRMALGPDLFALLFATADAIEEAGMRLREQHDFAGAPLTRLLPRLEAAACETLEAAASETMAVGSGERIANPSPGTQESEQAPGPARQAGPTVEVEPAIEAASGMPTVRIAAEKLDALLARSGELLVARRRVRSRSEDLAELLEYVSRWKTEWQAVERPLKKLLLENELGGTPQGEELAAPSRPQRDVFRLGGLMAQIAQPANHTRVLSRRLAHLLGRVGSNLRQLEKDVERLTNNLISDSRLLNQVAGGLDAEVRRLRMLPFAEACQGLDRLVHDLAQAGGKKVELVLEGGQVELDRSVLEGLKDPLRHLVRNAVAHAAEPPEERRACGKPTQARITVAATLRGSQVEVVVADDGRGLDLDALRQQVRKKKLAEPADDRELARLIFLPGLSTARLITDVSGRGVGLDVVKSRVEALHGTVDLSFVAGQGMRFTLAVPLTLTTLRALLVAAGGQICAFVGTNVQKLVRVDPMDLRSIEGKEMLPLGGAPLPIASLAETLGLPHRSPVADAPGRRSGKLLALVVAAGDRRMAFVVDEFLTEQEIVVKNLGARIRRMRHVAGATILPSGQIALVLNAANLVRTALTQPAGRPGLSLKDAHAPVAVEAKKRILVAEDSVTTRTLEKSILEAAGYEVAVAVDGADAWRLLQERGADLLVSDVEMPRMDGFMLTETVRGSQRFRDLPVVLLTSHETEQDKARGAQVGANAYLIKGAFDQRNLLETIAQLL
jgi:two-component system, chemotaxis family, sensor kinase CheA